MMLPLQLGRREASPASVLAIGAHPDDIEIGCAGTILKLIEQDALSDICWVVLRGNQLTARTRKNLRRRRNRVFEV